MASALIEYDKVTQRFLRDGIEFTACADIGLQVRESEFIAIVGPSGCGKSTLLNMAAGLLQPSQGQVRYRSRAITGPNTSVGYLTQRDTLLPWRTLEDNVGLALEIRRSSAAERRERARYWIGKVGLSGFETSYPAQMSGGMRRRALLARTLIYQPETILMDEPFGALDAHLRVAMHRDLQAICLETGNTVLLVTHDLEEALTLADRVVIFGGRPGRILGIQDVGFPRPRNLTKVRYERRFAELHEYLWGMLETSAPDLDAKVSP